MSELLVHGLTIFFAALGVLATVIIQLRSSSNIQGKTTQRLDDHDKRIEKVEEEQIRQWSAIGDNSTAIARLQGAKGRSS